MELSRRDFLKLSGASAGGLLLPTGFAAAVVAGEVTTYPLHKPVGEVPTICPYCAVGCGMVVGVNAGKVANIEGDPDHPISRGSLCSKGATLSQLADSDQRVIKPQYRAPNSDKWEDVEWDWALDQIARKIKDTRDANFIEKDAEGRLVNRLEAMAHVGSAALDNEECSILVKMMRSLGLVYIEHQARI
jgi:formate dehydrogenase major subunit